jgi:thiamine-monophosphate kinase
MTGLDEFGLIRRLTAGRGNAAGGPTDGPEERGMPGVAVGIGDDAAVLNGRPGFQWVVSCDTMVLDVHFKPETMTYRAIGHKAMASNISDMAAMGAIPRFALVALSVPAGVPVERLEELYDGLYGCGDRYGVAVVGGDTTSCPRDMTVTVTVIGEAETGKALLRSGARPGDAVFLTGPVGLSAAGLDLLLKRGGSAYDISGLSPQELRLTEAHQFPEPRVKAGRLLLQSGYGTSLNDISDGLASEAWELAEASGCMIGLVEDQLPPDPTLLAYAEQSGLSPLDLMLYGGEDYQLVGTADPSGIDALAALFGREGLRFYVIGTVAASSGGPGVSLRRSDGSLVFVGKRGYNHFTTTIST